MCTFSQIVSAGRTDTAVAGGRGSGIRFLLTCATIVSLAAAAFGSVSVARADILQISAIGFTLRTPTGSSDQIGEEMNGTLFWAGGRYMAPVVFPTDGLQVCSFALIYRDFDADHDVFASLQKKSFRLGTDTALEPTVVMAEVSSSGADTNTRRAKKSKIKQATVTASRAFYFVTIDIPEPSQLEILGVQIEYKATCP